MLGLGIGKLGIRVIRPVAGVSTNHGAKLRTSKNEKQTSKQSFNENRNCMLSYLWR